ncbi:hypothetical protein HOY80DRAFT_975301 [Tuber brumale]|nr:hypothetical protein HOY80DRAFT_975301 [Tuber brumale]
MFSVVQVFYMWIFFSSLVGSYTSKPLETSSVGACSRRRWPAVMFFLSMSVMDTKLHYFLAFPTAFPWQACFFAVSGIHSQRARKKA